MRALFCALKSGEHPAKAWVSRGYFVAHAAKTAFLIAPEGIHGTLYKRVVGSSPTQGMAGTPLTLSCGAFLMPTPKMKTDPQHALPLCG